MKTQTNGTIRIPNFIIQLTQVLGKGATGKVYRGFHQQTLQPVAIKAIHMSQITNQVMQYLLDGQKKAMSTIKNPYIVKTHQIIQEKDYCYIVMEVCSNGTLKQYIENKGRLTSTQAIDLFRKIVIGYTGIVDSLFIHRDLKAANILLRSNGDPVIIDFGYCQMIMGKRPMIAYNVGSPSYMSPQTYAKNLYSEKSDVWSLGVILYEMLMGRTLDYGLNIKEYFGMVERDGKVQIVGIEGMNTVCRQLLQYALQVDPQKRATIHKLKYIIDKSLIPKIQSQLRQTYSHTDSLPHKYKNIKFGTTPQSHIENCIDYKIKQKKKKIQRHIKLLRNSHQIQCQSPKIIPLITNHYNNCNSQCQQKYDQQPPIIQFTQNISPKIHHTPINRKSQQHINTPNPTIKNSHPIKQIDIKTVFKKVPTLTKTITQQQTNGPFKNSGSLISLRMI